MEWKLDRANFNHSTLSLELENDSYTPNESSTDTIRLADLTAPTHSCFCFRTRHFRLKKRHKTGKQKPKSKSDIPGTDGTPNHQFSPTSPLPVSNTPSTSNPDAPCSNIIVISSPQPDGNFEPNSMSPDLGANSELKLTIADSGLKQINKTNRYKVKFTAPECCSLMGPSRFKKSKRLAQLGQISLGCVWSIVSTILVSVSIALLIESGKKVYVYSDPNNDTFRELVNPPSFVSYTSSLPVVFIYPIYLILNLIFRFENCNLSDMIRHHTLIFASDQPKVVKILLRCTIFSSLWYLFLNCYLRSLRHVTAIDSAAITAVLPCFTYLLCWIIVHRRFCALRVIAFILASSGVILNIYSDQAVMGYKCLTTLSILCFSLFTVMIKRLSTKPSISQMACFYFIFALFILLFFWPIFMLTSLVTTAEVILWQHVPWHFVAGVAASIIGILLSMELSNRKTKRFVKALQPLCCLPICIVCQFLWFKYEEDYDFPNVRIASLVLITLASILNALPNGWQKLISKYVKRNRSPKSQLNATKRTTAPKSTPKSQGSVSTTTVTASTFTGTVTTTITSSAGVLAVTTATTNARNTSIATLSRQGSSIDRSSLANATSGYLSRPSSAGVGSRSQQQQHLSQGASHLLVKLKGRTSQPL